MASDKITIIDEYKVVKYGDKYWGVQYEDGYCTAHNWVNIEKAKKSYPLYEGKYYLDKPEDITHEGSPDIAELRKGKIVHIRETSVYEEING